ncbi:MAG: mRNA surveillance protein pelota [Candidatus Woesearchaeota archaeon]
MKVIHSDFRKGEVKIAVDSLDDLWYLSNIIENGDTVKGQTVRKIKLGEEGDRKTSINKRNVFLSISVENVEFHKYSNSLRISGVIAEGPEDVARGSHHTFNVEEGTKLTIQKESWPEFQKKRLKEASQQKAASILICIMDREEAYFALMKSSGYELLSTIKGEVERKDRESQKGRDFYGEIISALKNYDERYKLDRIVLASPAFWKEDLMNSLKDEGLKKRIVLANCSSSDEKAFNEVLKRPEVQEALRQDRMTREINKVERLLAEISKGGPASYGLRQVEQAAAAGAVEELLITDSCINDSRQSGEYEMIDKLLKTAESSGGEIHMISSEHDGGKKLDGLGGIGAMLRYRME